MRFRHIKWEEDKGQLLLTYEEESEALWVGNEVKGKEEPARSFFEAMGALVADVTHHLPFLADEAERIDVRGLTMNYPASGRAWGLTMTAVLPVEGLRSPFNIAVPFHEPTPEERRRVLKVFAETRAYLEGKRGQLSLFVPDDDPPEGEGAEGEGAEGEGGGGIDAEASGTMFGDGEAAGPEAYGPDAYRDERMAFWLRKSVKAVREAAAFLPEEVRDFFDPDRREAGAPPTKAELVAAIVDQEVAERFQPATAGPAASTLTVEA